MVLMRRNLAAVLLLFVYSPGTSVARQVDPNSQPAEVTVTVYEHRMTTDIVEVTALAREYPKGLMLQQAKRLCELLGSPMQGFQYMDANYGDRSNLQFIKCRFGTQGLIDGKNHQTWLEPIVRAFAGAPEPNTVHNLYVMFQGQAPTDKTLRRYVTENVVVSGQGSANPPYIDYRVSLLVQDPEKLTIPREFVATTRETTERMQPKGMSAWVWVLITLAAVAAGALVYSLVLRFGARSSAKGS